MKRRRSRRRRRPYTLRRLRRGPLLVVALIVVAFLAGEYITGTGSSADRSSHQAAAGDADFSGRVTRIVDGDTFWISSQDTSIRIWRLDAPETGTSGGSAATAALTRLIGGETLNCHRRDIDRYGRIVAQCVLPSGREIAGAMIAGGTATEYCHFSRNYYGTC